MSIIKKIAFRRSIAVRAVLAMLVFFSSSTAFAQAAYCNASPEMTQCCCEDSCESKPQLVDNCCEMPSQQNQLASAVASSQLPSPAALDVGVAHTLCHQAKASAYDPPLLLASRGTITRCALIAVFLI